MSKFGEKKLPLFIYFVLIVLLHSRDRRSLAATKKPAGVLMGHTEGITFVSAKGDGRYIISNGKDQSLRLWDLRRMRTSAEHEAAEANFYGIPSFDYRFCLFSNGRFFSHINCLHPDIQSTEGQDTKLTLRIAV